MWALTRAKYNILIIAQLKQAKSSSQLSPAPHLISGEQNTMITKMLMIKCSLENDYLNEESSEIAD